MLQKIEHLYIEPLMAVDYELTNLVSQWYFHEWKLPKETTLKRLNLMGQSSNLYQAMIFDNGIPIGTGGLSYETRIMDVFPDLKDIGPWLDLLYIIPSKRRYGIGSLLCEHIEAESRLRGFSTLYSYTNTAEALFHRRDWQTYKRVIFRSRNTAVLKKDLIMKSNLRA